MPVSLTHAYVTGGNDICAAIERVVDRAAEVVSTEAQAQLAAQHSRLRESVAAHPKWSHLAGDVEHWADEDGDAVYGVPDHSPQAGQAVKMEYGDAEDAPTGLIRMGVMSGVVEMGWSMQERFRRAGF